MTETVLAGLFTLATWVFLWAIVFTTPSWLLWNWLMPKIFGLPEITFFQCFGLLILSGTFFGGTRFKLKVRA